MYDLSIVIPTCNRASLLAQCLQSVIDSVKCCYEVIVVDGASSDDTPRVLQRASILMGPSLRVIEETRREGFVRAVNKGFRAAQGQFLTWVNDDARPLEHALDRAVDQLAFSPRDVGMVAIFQPASVPVIRTSAGRSSAATAGGSVCRRSARPLASKRSMTLA